MASIEELIPLVRKANTPAAYWSAQMQLLLAMETQERIIHKRKRQHQSLRMGIARYARAPGKSRARLTRWQSVLRLAEASRQSHSFRREGVAYLADTLAHRLLPAHVIRQLGKNHRSGFISGQIGRSLELKTAEFLKDKGWSVLLHDLTHCLRIGDLTAVCKDHAPMIIECQGRKRYSKRHADKKTRQNHRMDLLGKVLNEDVEGIDYDELAAHGFPFQFVEFDETLRHNNAAFTEACQISTSGFKVLRPEEGVIYACCASDCPVERLMTAVFEAGRGWRNVIFSSLTDRIRGRFSWIPPILLLDIPCSQMAACLSGDVRFFVFIDVDHVKRQLALLVPLIRVNLVGCDEVTLECRQQDSISWLGPRPFENVQYGLATLESALRLIARMGRSTLPRY